MARSSADDMELLRACEGAIEGTKQKIVLSMRVAKSRGPGKMGKHAKPGKMGKHAMAKPRVLAISTKSKGAKGKAFLRVLKYSSGGVLEPAKLYKLKHLSKMEVVASDPSGCTFVLGFDNLKSKGVAPPQWTMRNVDDRNRMLHCILNISKDVMGRMPKIVGIDLVEMAVWAKENPSTVKKQKNRPADGPISVIEDDDDDNLDVAVEKELVSQAEEEDMEALLSTYVMGVGEAEEFAERLKRELLALEAANVHSILESQPQIFEVLQGLETSLTCVDDMDEWLAIFNVKLRHMREDIELIETRNNKLEIQSVNNIALIDELDHLFEGMRVPSEYAACIVGGSFDEACMPKNIEVCEWLAGALRGLEETNIDPTYANMLALKEKRAELEKQKSTFVWRASEYMKTYFASLVDFMINDKGCFSQRGQLKKPDHSDLRYKCRKYSRFITHLKSLDKNGLGPLRKGYCDSLNLLLRREARDFANELRASTKATKNPTGWFDASAASSKDANAAETSGVSDAYAKMLTVFIPVLVDESSFFAHFMCFGVAISPPGGASGHKSGYEDDEDEDDMDLLGIDENESNDVKNPADLAALNEALQDLLDGIQEDFYSVVDWAYKIDPLRCISMYGITEHHISEQKGDAAGFVRILLGDLGSRVSMQFGRFVDEACAQIEKCERGRQTGVLPYIPRFSALATRMEQYIQGETRDLVDQAYVNFVSIMFVTLEKIAQADLKHCDVFLLENYAAFQNSVYDLANVVPILAKLYHQASEAYEEACTRHISMIIYTQFEKLFQFARKIEDLMYTMPPEEIPFQVGLSKNDLRKIMKSSLSGVDKSVAAMHKKLQKSLTSDELLPSLWDKCKKEFLDKYESFALLAAKIYPNENVPPPKEIKDILG